MRLTLRTLLAYLDQNLEPGDSQEIASKVKESEFATTLVHRIRDVTRRLRLGAPKVEGRGLALDANTVAEYLDNSLSAERVPDFERICLESDIHLAEVAASHQVLALVLDKPAEIEPAIRQRMYALPSQAAAHDAAGSAAPAEADSASSAAGGEAASSIAASVEHEAEAPRRVAPTPPPIPPRDTPRVPAVATDTAPVPETVPSEADLRPARRQIEVPEYLRESTPRRGSRGRLIAALLLFIVVGAAIGVLLNGEQLQSWLASSNPPTEGTDLPTATMTGQTTSKDLNVVPGLDDAGKIPGGLQQPASMPTTPAATAPTTAVPTPAAPTSPTAPAANVPTAPTPGTPTVAPAAGTPAAPGTVAQPASLPPGTAPPVVVPGAAPAAPGTAPTAPGMAPNPPPVATTPPTGIPGTTPAIPGTPATPGSAIPAPPAPGIGPVAMNAGTPGVASGAAAPVAQPVVVPPAAPEGVGQYMNESDLLVRAINGPLQWERMLGKATVLSGNRLLCLPSYSAKLAMTAGVRVDLLGGAEVKLLPNDPQKVPGVELVEGRIMVLEAARPETALNVVINGQPGRLVLADQNSAAALDVDRLHLEGTDPEKQAGPVEAVLYAFTGQISWTDATGKTEKLAAPVRRVLMGSSTTQQAGMPRWLTSEERSATQIRASAELPKLLPQDRPISQALQEEAATGRKQENVLLSLQALARLDDYNPLVLALKERTQRSLWPEVIDALRDAIGRSPQHAEQVRKAFEKHYGAKGLELYRMLWGYTPDQIQSGGGMQLVRYLDHEDLEFRVLSIGTLKRMAGTDLFYRPDDTVAKRQPFVVKWKQKIETGQLFSR
ncbi:MAG: hypothetical protein JSS27_08960 [Planctomycetes bacterium]|nr:hypothetical protein [Planctomycetota bacterium]